MNVRENYAPRRIAANGTLDLSNNTALGGFLCETGGTLTLTIAGSLVAAIPVTAGVFTPLPFGLAGTSSIVLSGGAVGAAAVV